jgi:Outer membrane protein beta-barrel domain
MKRQIFTLALMALLFAPVLLSAQGLGIGIKAGANFANLSTDNYSTSAITGYHVGAYANINFSEKWGITPEVLWSAQGAELDNAEFNTDYVTVPIMVRWRIIKLISIEAGPQFNFLTNADLEGYAGDIKDQLKSSTYSVAFGALIHLPLGFNGGVRYVMGVSDLSDNDNVEFRDQTFQIYVGWTIFGAK